MLRLLEPKDKFRFSVSLLLTMVATLLELLSLGMVIPVVQVVLGEEKLEAYGWVPDFVEDMKYQTFVIVLLGALVTAFILKNVFLVLANYYQQRSQLSLSNRIMHRLFENYLKQPYEYHLIHSSSVLLRNVTDYAGAVLTFIGPSLVLIGDIFTGLAFLVLLLVVQPVSTLAIGVLFGAGSWIILRITRPRARVWGEDRMRYRATINAALLAGFGGVKEIKLFGRDREVVEVHRSGLYAVSRTVYMFNVIQSLPKATFEVLAVMSISLTIVIARLRGESNEDAILVIALFGVVAFRMLPSINRIVVALQQIAITRPGLEGAVDGLSLMTEQGATVEKVSLGKFESLEVRNLQYCYPNTQKLVVNLESWKISAGDSIGVVGSSGSGKSTLVDLLIGILDPTGGQILVNGHSSRTAMRSWQDKIGYVPQYVYLMDTTIRRNVAFGLPEGSIDDSRVERALQQAHLLDFVNTLPLGWDTETGDRGVRLSGGQRQRLGIARALYANPEVIVLDEATSALDSATEREIVESFRELATGHTLIVVAHRTSTLKYCSRLIRIEEGRIVQEGTFEEVVGSLSDDSNRGQ